MSRRTRRAAHALRRDYPGRPHPDPDVQQVPTADVRQALTDLLRVIDMLMPGVRYIAVQDYAALNDVPIAARKLLQRLTEHTP